jgi:GntR family transcriptional regulator
MPFYRKQRQAEEIEQVLRERIRLIENPNSRLPSEVELAEEFGVSRVTVREALAELEHKGLIVRRHGLGTFINSRGVNIRTRLDESIELGELIRSWRYDPELRYLDYQQQAASAEIAARLKIEPGAPVLWIAKVFTASGSPIVYCINVIPLGLLPASSHSAIIERLLPELSVYSVLARWFSQQVAFQISDVQACNADLAYAILLECAEGTALLRLVDVGFNDQQQPVFFGDMYFVPGMIEFQLIRKPVYNIETDSYA